MKKFSSYALALLVVSGMLLNGSMAEANAYREKGKVFEINDSGLRVTPPRDWNRLAIKRGKFAETWTLDGEQLNDVTFYGGVETDKPLVKERDKKRDPLPKFRSDTLLVEIPELVQGTYRAYKGISSFTMTNSKPGRFLGRDGIEFIYEFTDNDNLPRKGEGRAAIISGKLYMVTFDAPRLHYFERTRADFHALADTAFLAK